MVTGTLFSRLQAAYRSIGSPDRVMAAVSGGADSVALLSLLCRLRAEEKLQVVAVHVNHGLRDASEGEEKAVLELCRRLDVLCRVYHVQVEAGNTEEKARTARYEALFAAAEEYGCRYIALAHHAGDQAETVLMRMVRGCGDGLSGMRELTCRREGLYLWRPLLSVVPEELRKWNTNEQLLWCEDESNRDEKYVRNFFRHRILPLMESRFGNARVNITQSADIIRWNNDYIEQ